MYITYISYIINFDTSVIVLSAQRLLCDLCEAELSKQVQSIAEKHQIDVKSFVFFLTHEFRSVRKLIKMCHNDVILYCIFKRKTLKSLKYENLIFKYLSIYSSAP